MGAAQRESCGKAESVSEVNEGTFLPEADAFEKRE